VLHWSSADLIPIVIVIVRFFVDFVVQFTIRLVSSSTPFTDDQIYGILRRGTEEEPTEDEPTTNEDKENKPPTNDNDDDDGKPPAVETVDPEEAEADEAEGMDLDDDTLPELAPRHDTSDDNNTEEEEDEEEPLRNKGGRPKGSTEKGAFTKMVVEVCERVGIPDYAALASNRTAQ